MKRSYRFVQTSPVFDLEHQLLFEYDGEVVHVKLKSMNNHLLRDLLLGLWLSLDDEDRREHVGDLALALTHPEAEIPELSRKIGARLRQNLDRRSE